MIFIVIFCLIILICIFVVLKSNKHKKHSIFLLNNSIALEKLFEINNRYSFFDDIKDYIEEHVYDNKKLYDNIDCEDYLIYQLQFKMNYIEKIIRNTQYNKKNFALYCREVSKITEFGQFKNLDKTLDLKYLKKLENTIFEQKTLKPETNFKAKVILYCSKINGEIYEKKQWIFSSKEILELINRLNDRNGDYYYDNAIWGAICRVERGKVSNKLRFAIYKRDGYKCRKCGSTQCLEIDHIVPISKGGKSTYNNLQTLCKRCNKEKGDLY